MMRGLLRAAIIATTAVLAAGSSGLHQGTSPSKEVRENTATARAGIVTTPVLRRSAVPRGTPIARYATCIDPDGGERVGPASTQW